MLAYPFYSFNLFFTNFNFLLMIKEYWHFINYLHSNQYQKGVKLFEEMKEKRVNPDTHTYTTLFSILAKMKDNQNALLFINHWNEARLQHSEFSASSAISMLSKCNLIYLAQRVSFLIIFLQYLLSL